MDTSILRGTVMLCGIVHVPENFSHGDYFAGTAFRRRTLSDRDDFDRDDPVAVGIPRENLATLYTSDFIDALFPGSIERDMRDADVYSRIVSYRRVIADGGIQLFVPAATSAYVDGKYLAMKLKVTAVDCYFFPGGIMIYAVFVDPAGLPLRDFMEILPDMYMVNFYPAPMPRERGIVFSPKYLSLFDDAVGIACQGEVAGVSHGVFEGNKLYAYVALTISGNADFGGGYDRRRLLADMTRGNGFGASAGGSLRPGRLLDSFIDRCFETCAIEMYSNWAALAGPDVFACISDSGVPFWADQPWSSSRYLIFINALLRKAMLMKISAETHRHNIDMSFEAEYLKLDRVLNPPIISHNELPQRICDILRRSFGVNSQLEIIEAKISKNAEKKRDSVEQLQNYILFALAFLGIFDAVNAFNALAGRSEWLTWPNIVIAVMLLLIFGAGILKWRSCRRL